jgi:hypothetical protein
MEPTSTPVLAGYKYLLGNKRRDVLLYFGLFSCTRYSKLIHFSLLLPVKLRQK